MPATDPSLHPPAPTERLDRALVERGLVATRAKARDLVLRGCVSVGGRSGVRPATLVRAGDAITVDGRAAREVSRGEAKLAAALDHFGLDPAGRTALDIGASTGGFTAVLLARGAARVHAIDVGRGQLDPRLAGDARVVAHEGTDARALDRAIVPDPIAAVVADVSFISLTKALPAALALAVPGCWLVALVKPQFEAGREAVGKGGIVRDEAARRASVDATSRWLATAQGWSVLGAIECPVAGGDGNREWLLAAIRP